MQAVLFNRLAVMFTLLLNWIQVSCPNSLAETINLLKCAWRATDMKPWRGVQSYFDTHSKGHKEAVWAENTATQVEEQVAVGRTRHENDWVTGSWSRRRSRVEQLPRQRLGTHWIASPRHTWRRPTTQQGASRSSHFSSMHPMGGVLLHTCFSHQVNMLVE